MFNPKVISVIVHQDLRGNGTEGNPYRRVTQYLDFEGILLAESRDPCKVAPDTMESANPASNTGYTAALEDIIKWLDGSNGSFPIRKPGEGAYYWRKEMAKRLNAAKARHCV